MNEYELRINDRRLIDGPIDNLMCISPIKHTWANDFWKRMLANTWFPTVVDMSRDIKMYKSLSSAERNMYDSALAFLSNLDGIQFNNLTKNIGHYITSPEVNFVHRATVIRGRAACALLRNLNRGSFGRPALYLRATCAG